jgi:hypothetical protein
MCESSLQPFRMCMQWWRKKSNQGAVKYQRERLASERSDTRTCCPSVSNNYTLRTPMNVALCSASPRAACLLPAHRCSLVLCACCLPMDAVLCSASPRAPRLLPAHRCSFVLRACCHTHGYSFVLHVCCRVRFAFHTHAGTATPKGTNFACAPYRAYSWNTCNIKHLLQHMSEIY